MLPAIAGPALEQRLVRVRALHVRDLAEVAGRVALPTGLDRTAPSWAAALAWQRGFPASRRVLRRRLQRWPGWAYNRLQVDRWS